MGKLFGGHAEARIAECDGDVLIVRVKGDCDRAAVLHRLQGVLEKVKEDLLHLLGVEGDVRERGGNVQRNGNAAFLVDDGVDGVAHIHQAALHHAQMQKLPSGRFFTVFHPENGFTPDDYAAVAYLTAAFCVESGFVKNDYRVGIDTDEISLFAVCGNGKNLAVLFSCAVAGEFRCTALLKGNVGTFPALRSRNLAGCLCQSLCVGKVFFKFFVVDGQSVFLRDFAG